MGLQSVSSIFICLLLFLGPTISAISIIEALKGENVDSSFNPSPMGQQNSLRRAEIIEKLTRRRQETREAQPFGNIQTLLLKLIENFDDTDYKNKQEKTKRPKRATERPSTNSSISSKKELDVSQKNTTIASNVTIQNGDIVLIRNTILGPVVAICDILARTPMVNTNPLLLFVILVVRTILAVTDGTLSYLTGVNAPTQSIRAIRSIFDKFLATPGSSKVK